MREEKQRGTRQFFHWSLFAFLPLLGFVICSRSLGAPGACGFVSCSSLIWVLLCPAESFLENLLWFVLFQMRTNFILWRLFVRVVLQSRGTLVNQALHSLYCTLICSFSVGFLFCQFYVVLLCPTLGRLPTMYCNEKICLKTKPCFLSTYFFCACSAPWSAHSALFEWFIWQMVKYVVILTWVVVNLMKWPNNYHKINSFYWPLEWVYIRYILSFVCNMVNFTQLYLDINTNCKMVTIHFIVAYFVGFTDFILLVSIWLFYTGKVGYKFWMIVSDFSFYLILMLVIIQDMYAPQQYLEV